MNPSIRLPDYINLTSSIRLQPDDCRIKTTTDHNQYHIHTHIHIQLHLHNHIFTISLCNPITLLQSSFDIDQSTKNDLIQTMTAYTKHDTNERKDTKAQSIAHRFRTHRNFSYISGAKFFSHIMRVYRGRFQTGDNACVYLWQNFRSA